MNKKYEFTLTIRLSAKSIRFALSKMEKIKERIEKVPGVVVEEMAGKGID